MFELSTVSTGEPLKYNSTRAHHFLTVKRLGLSTLSQAQYDLMYFDLIRGNKEYVESLFALTLFTTAL